MKVEHFPVTLIAKTQPGETNLLPVQRGLDGEEQRQKQGLSHTSCPFFFPLHAFIPSSSASPLVAAANRYKNLLVIPPSSCIPLDPGEALVRRKVLGWGTQEALEVAVEETIRAMLAWWMMCG